VSAEAYRWRCSCCGGVFTGLPLDIAFDPPVDWDSLDEEDRQTALVNDDFCAVRFPDGQVDRFIRCILQLPVPRLPATFRFGVWVSVSEQSWQVYRDGFDSGEYSQPGCFGYLMNAIPEFEAAAMLHANVRFEPGNARPTVELQEAAHPLARAQREGVGIEQVERWVAMTHRK
jgi:hypothetical protein